MSKTPQLLDNAELSPLSPTLSLKPQQRQTWTNLHGSSMGLLLNQLAQQQQHLLVVVTTDALTAQQLREELHFFSAKSTIKPQVSTQNIASAMPDITTANSPTLQYPVFSFPDWETLIYDIFSPHQDIISERLATLALLPLVKHGVLIVNMTTLMHRLPPIDYIRNNSLLLKCGQTLNLEQFRMQLQLSGYRSVSQVVEHGEFSVRGSLIDLFPMGSDLPFRIDLFDDEIDSIRTFDPETQRSLNKLNEIHLLPAREFPLTPEAISLFKTQWRSTFQGDPRRCPVYQQMTENTAAAGIEYYLPFFFKETNTLFDYLPKNSVILTLPSVYENAQQFIKEIQERYEQLRHDIERPILTPNQLCLRLEETFAYFKHYPHIQLQTETPTEIEKNTLNYAVQALPPHLASSSHATTPFIEFKQFLNSFKAKILLVAETLGRRENLLELLKKAELKATLVETWQDFLKTNADLCVTVAPLERGFILQTPLLALITETQLLGERVTQRRRRRHSATQRDTDTIVRNLTELTIGAPVVHEEHGVGRYQGLITLQLSGFPAEFLHLEYANGDKLYVPVASLHLISRFTGVDPEHAPLHKLGSGQWEKAKRKAAQQVTDVAVELLDIYAKRAARKGHIFQCDMEDYREFVQGFPFEETPDQADAINAVLDDMLSERPMDRLVCGDVGFGKTEVAMRAAFVAVQDGRQVAVLVPTTLLAQQHYQNFLDRFAEFPVKIEQLSRFRSKKEQTHALQQIEVGQIDIVIGTHKLLQDNIKFKNLGLVIIDEEHRFGVKQKERFKALRSEVDILTLTATPIPRSLNMALSNLRELSVIATAPSKRLAVKTFIKEWHAPSIAEAIVRELRRGGQVYFVHNDIDNIEKIAQDLMQLVPEARVEIAHGQLRERELERVMQDFYHRRFNVLVCTTIIETGIDVPTANTIIINRADKFGLAQLYQLRGRVGRSHHRAYAYLIVPAKKLMTQDAVKRLDAIASLEELGVGFRLATHDLEIRGAGELLGEEQSGQIQEIGYSLYTELLERAIESLKAGKTPDLEQVTKHTLDIDLRVPALIPSDYLPDIHSRLILYKRLASATSLEEVKEIHIEMIDRFGLLPEATQALIQITELKLQAHSLGLRKIEFSENGGYIQFYQHTSVEPQKLIQLIQSNPSLFKFDGKDKLHLNHSELAYLERVAVLEQILKKLIN